MEAAAGIAKNRVGSVGNIKQMLLEHAGLSPEEQCRNETLVRGGRLEGLQVRESFAEFLHRKGRKPRA